MKDVNVRLADLELAIFGCEPFSSILYKHFPPRRNAFVLEVGSGSGKLSINYAIRGCCATLLDVDEEVLNYSWDLVQASNHILRSALTVIIRRGSVLELPFEDNSFSFAFSEGLFEHFLGEKRQKCFSEIARVSREKVLVFVPNAQSEEAMKNAEVLEFTYPTTERKETPFAPSELLNSMTNAGLHNVLVAPVFGEDLKTSKMLYAVGEKNVVERGSNQEGSKISPRPDKGLQVENQVEPKDSAGTEQGT